MILHIVSGDASDRKKRILQRNWGGAVTALLLIITQYARKHLK